MKECVINFKRGLRIFWAQECKPELLNLSGFMATIVAVILVVIACCAIAVWAVITLIWVLVTSALVAAWLGLKGAGPLPHVQIWLNCMGVSGVAVLTVFLATLFVRHVVRLGKSAAPATGKEGAS